MINLQNFVAISRNTIKFQPLHLLKRFHSTSNESEILDLFQGKGDTDDGKQYVPDVRPQVQQEQPKKKKKNENVIIKCNRSEFDHHRNQKYDKMKPIPLASKGWFHNKSKGDFFTIQIYDKDHIRDSLFWEESLPDFSEMQLDDALKEAIKRNGFVKPTKIQHESIPVLLSGRNTLIAAETGCGKTLAFLVPVLQQILHWKQQYPKRPQNTPLALILTPSRELASQIGSITKEFCNHLPISCNILTGGKTKQKMVHPEFRTVDVQIATLGAMSKLTSTGVYDISEVRHLIIDESDTMLDDSFCELLLQYLRKFKIQYKPTRNNGPSGCQLTLVSATFPSNFDQTLSDFTAADSFTKVTSKSLHRFLPHVPQTFYRLGASQKPTKLLHLIKQSESQKMPTMIFSNKSPTCDWITLMLQENGIKIINLNGEMPLAVRKGKYDEFLSGEANFLSCTDIASRGLDTKSVRHVVNYDFPLYMADYIHRCGRTGRCGSSNDCRISNFISGIREVELVNKIEMAVRTQEALPNVNGNITKIIRRRISDLYSTDKNKQSVKN